MEMLFMLMGWDFAVDGKKATQFDTMCKALGVTFDFTLSHQRILQVSNAKARKEELVQQLGAALESGVSDKQACLVLQAVWALQTALFMEDWDKWCLRDSLTTLMVGQRR